MLLTSITAEVTDRNQGKHRTVHQLSLADRTVLLALILLFAQYCMAQAVNENRSYVHKNNAFYFQLIRTDYSE